MATYSRQQIKMYNVKAGDDVAWMQKWWEMKELWEKCCWNGWSEREEVEGRKRLD